MMTLFDLLIVNNWFIIVDGVVASSGWPEARIFFLAYCPHNHLPHLLPLSTMDRLTTSLRTDQTSWRW